MKKAFCLGFIFIFTGFFCCLTHAELANYDDGIFAFSYDDSSFSVDVTDEGTVRVHAFNMPDDGGGHNTVLVCMSMDNTAYSDLGELTDEDLSEFSKSFSYEMCRGLFDMDSGVVVEEEGYRFVDGLAEYHMHLSDNSDCYTRELNYGSKIYYVVCRLCDYSSSLNPDFKEIYDGISFVQSSDGHGVVFDDLLQQIEQLEAENSELKNKISELESEVSSLEKEIESKDVKTSTKKKPKETESEKISVDDKIIISASARQHINSTYDYTAIDDIVVNDNMERGDGTYIVLVYLTWNQKNSQSTTLDMLDMYSSDFAATIGEDFPKVDQVALFWTVPYHNNATAKWSYYRSGDNMYLEDNSTFGF